MPREKSSPHRKSLPETQQLVKEMCPRDNYRTQNEFIEKAIRFYAGYVSGQDTTAYLPPALASVLRGTVQDTENRVCRLLFKLAVDLDMMMNVLAAGIEIPDEQLKALRGRCGQDVKKNQRQHFAGRRCPLPKRRSVITRTLFKFCAAKQRIKVLEKSSSYSPRSVVCVGVAESEKGDDTHGEAQTIW